MNSSDVNEAKWLTLREEIAYMCKSPMNETPPSPKSSRPSPCWVPSPLNR